MNSSEMLTPRQAAKRIGVSYSTLKKLILAGRIRSVKTPGGHHRVPSEALDELLPAKPGPLDASRLGSHTRLVGSVLEITIDGLMAKVILDIGDQRVTAIVTADAIAHLDLKPGDSAFALIKATDIMVGHPSPPAQ